MTTKALITLASSRSVVQAASCTTSKSHTRKHKKYICSPVFARCIAPTATLKTHVWAKLISRNSIICFCNFPGCVNQIQASPEPTAFTQQPFHRDFTQHQSYLCPTRTSEDKCHGHAQTIQKKKTTFIRAAISDHHTFPQNVRMGTSSLNTCETECDELLRFPCTWFSSKQRHNWFRSFPSTSDSTHRFLFLLDAE